MEEVLTPLEFGMILYVNLYIKREIRFQFQYGNVYERGKDIAMYRKKGLGM